MTGSAAGRSNMRSPGRTPPFILIGLLVLVGFLGYKYWSYHSENYELRNEVEKVRVQARDFDQKRSESEKNLELSREELGRAKVDREGIQKQLQEKEAELNNVKSEFTKKQSEAETIQKNLATCDENLQARVAEVDKVKAENGELSKSLEAEKSKSHVCDFNSCVDPLKQVIEILTKIIGSEQVGKALNEAKLDAATLMNGIPNYPGPQQLAQNIQQQPAQKIDQNESRNLNTENNGNIKEMVIGNDEANKKSKSEQSDNLVFQSDKDNATAKTDKAQKIENNNNATAKTDKAQKIENKDNATAKSDQAQKLENDESYDSPDTPSSLSPERENVSVGYKVAKGMNEAADTKKKEDKDIVGALSEGDKNVDDQLEKGGSHR